MTKKRGLGRGLSALLEDNSTEVIARPEGVRAEDVAPPRAGGTISTIPVDQIEPNPFQPRTTFSQEALLELASSIRSLGIIQPVTVRKMGYNRYQLISGERRFRASQAAGLKEVPAYVRVANDEAMLEMALVENIQREELDAIEVAISFQRLVDEVKLTHEELSHKVGKDRATITNYLRLLKLPAEVQLGLRQRQIAMGHARALINVPDPARQIELYHLIVESQLSVRQVEELAREKKFTNNKPAKATIVHFRDLAKQLTKQLGVKVNVKGDVRGKGKFEIPFADALEMEAIVKRFPN